MIYYLVVVYAFKSNLCIQTMKNPFLWITAWFGFSFLCGVLKLILVCCLRRDTWFAFGFTFMVHLTQLAVIIYSFQFWLGLENRCWLTLPVLFWFIYTMFVFFKAAMIIIVCMCVGPWICLFMIAVWANRENEQ